MNTAGSQLGPLRQLVGRTALEALSDRDLLARFADSRDGDAFAVLVERHGPGVLNHCRRLLGDLSAADDAFQATFLVLARKAKSLRSPEALAGWLFGTARRVALRARRRMPRREAPLIDVPAATRDPLAEMSARELLNVLDEEIARLPERFRLPLLLCAVEGQSVSDAARALGTTASTVKGRLERGRAKLRCRLAGHGLALPAALTALLAVPRESVSAALLEVVVDSATSERVSPTIADLVGHTLPFRIGFKSVCVAVLILSATAGTILVLKPPPAMEIPSPKSPDPVKPDDPLPAGALNRFGSLRLRGCRGPVLFSPDGNYVVAAGRTAADFVLVFDAKTGREVKSFNAKSTIQRLAFSPDGRRLAAVGGGYNANSVWDFESGKLLGAFHGNDLAFAPDGKHLKTSVVRGQKTTIMTFAEGGEKIHEAELPVAEDRGFSLSPAGWFAVGQVDNSGTNVAVFDLAKRTVAKRLNFQGGPILGTAFDASEKRIVAHGSNGFTVWDWHEGKELFRWAGRVYNAPTFSADGKQVAWTGESGSGGSVWVTDLAGGKPRKLSPMERRGSNPPAFSPDGKSVAIVTDGGAVQILDTQTGRDRVPLPAMTGRVWRVGFTPDRRQIIAGDALRVFVWDAASGRLLRRFPDDLPEGERAVANTIVANRVVTFRQADGTVRLRDIDTLHEVRRLESKLKPLDVKYGELYRNGAVTPDGRFAALEGLTNAVCVFDLATGKQLSQHPLAGRATHYRWSDDGQFLAIERERFEGPLVLDPRTGKELEPAKWSAWWVPPGGRWPEWGEKAVARLRKLDLLDATGQPVFSGETGFITEVTESSRSRYLAVFGRTGQPNVIDERNKSTFWLFDLATRRQLDYAVLPEGEYFKLFSPNSRLFATTTMQGTVHVREVATGRERLRFDGHLPGEVTSLAFSRDGRALLSGGADTQVFVWDLIGGAGKSSRPLAEQWNALASDDAADAQKAIGGLIADPQDAISLIAQRLKPPPAPNADQMVKWAEQLGDTDFSIREKATAELAKAGEHAIPELRRALKGASLERRRRTERLLRDLEGSALSGDRLRCVRAVEVLEQIASPAARLLLTELAKGPALVRMTVEAQESLRRLGEK